MSLLYIALTMKCLLPLPSKEHLRQPILDGALKQLTSTGITGTTGTQPQFKLLERTNMIAEDFVAACELLEDSPDDVVYGEFVPDGFKHIATIEKGSGRWFTYVWSVFERDGQYVAVEWAQGLTEMQENEIEISRFSTFEVQPYDQIVVSFKKVPAEDVA